MSFLSKIPFNLESHYMTYVGICCNRLQVQANLYKLAGNNIVSISISELTQKVFNFYITSRNCSDTIEKKLLVMANKASKKLSDLILNSPSCQITPELIKNWRIACLYEERETPYLPNFTFNRKDYLAAGIEDQSSFSTIMCFSFAFFLVNDTRAMKFYSTYFSNPMDALTKWGYRLTSSPTVGDLIVYCLVEGVNIHTQHMGVKIDNNLIISKFGEGEVTVHLPEEVFLHYGNHFTYFHKEHKSYLVNKLLSKLTRACERANTTLTATLLTQSGLIATLDRTVRNQPIKHTFSRSLYNVEFNERVRTAILKKIEELGKLNPQLSNEEILNNLKVFVSTLEPKIPIPLLDP